jgi:hypothetical protein
MLGYTLLAAGVLTGIATKLTEPKFDEGYVIFLILFFAGGALLLFDASWRLWRGEVTLRPKDAAKPACLIFLFIVALKSLHSMYVGTLETRWFEHVWTSAVFAVCISLYTTAYRRSV